MLDFIEGPRIFKVPGSTGLVLATAAAVPGFAPVPSVSEVLSFRFPYATFVAGLLVLLDPDGVSPTLAAQHAKVGLRVVDETAQPMVTDLRGTIRGNDVPVSARLLAMQGIGFHPIGLQRPLDGGDVWKFTLQNESTAVAQRCEGIYLYLENP